MKQVTNQKQTVSPEEVNLNKYYAVLSKNGQTGLIHRQKLDGYYWFFSSSSLTVGNGWSTFDSQSLRSTVLRLLDDKNSSFKVFEFDTAVEMYAWLAENTKR
jgi:hypothetical protein